MSSAKSAVPILRHPPDDVASRAMDLHPGEQVLLDTRPSWRSTIGTYLIGDVLAVIVVIALIAAGQTLIGIVAGVAIIAIATVKGSLERVGTRYVITDQRLILRRGILSKHEQRVALARVSNVATAQTFKERLLGIGTVEFETSVDEPDVAFRGIDDPADVVRKVESASR